MVLQLTSRRSDAAAHLVLSGELDIAESSRVERELLSLDEGRPDTLVIDLRGLQFMDSTGLRLIVAAHQRYASEGRRVVIIRGPDAVQRVFQATRVEERLYFVDQPPA